MCRWIAFISQQPILIEDLLVDAPHPITINCHYLPDDPDGPGKARYNFDGFGVAWYTDTRCQFDTNTHGPRPALYKTTAIPITDPTFTYICANTASKCLLAHVRAASLPPVVPTNNHPFVFGRHSFMHNGTIKDFQKIISFLKRLEILKEILPVYAEIIYGNTDSEHLAALYFTYLGDIQQSYTARKMKDAMAKAVLRVQTIQFKAFGKETINDMNLCTTDGENLVALRWRNGPNPNPPSLYVSYDADAWLNRKHKFNAYRSHSIECTPEELVKNAKPVSEELLYLTKWNPHGPHVVVASEPATFIKGEWTYLENGQFIMVDSKGRTVTDWENIAPKAGHDLPVIGDQNEGLRRRGLTGSR